jgi:flagellin
VCGGVSVAVSIGSNISSLTAQRKLSATTNDLSRVYERLSSGLRINRASDDAAGLAVSSTLNSEQRVFGAALRNINDGISVISIMSAALDGQSHILGRLSELAEQSANGSLSSAQRSTLQAEYAQLVKEFGRTGDTTTFNGLDLLRGNRGNLSGGINIQAGIRGDANSRIGLAGVDLATLSGTVDVSSLTYDFNGDGNQNNFDFDLFAEGGTEAELRAGFGNNVVFLDGSHTASGRNVAVVLLKSKVDNTIGVFAIEQQVDGDYVGDFFTYLDAADFDTIGSGAISYDPGSGVVTSVNPITTYSADGGSALLTDFSGFLFQDNSQSGSTAIEFTGVDTVTNARNALDVVRNKIAELGLIRGTIGATESRFLVALNLVAQAKETRRAAESRIMDADLGADSAELVRKQILQQSGAAILAQANQTPTIALTLLR